MTDIQQWRRRIQPTRARTPAIDAEEPDGIASPTTPRKGLKPKLSSYFMQHSNTGPPSRTDFVSGEELLNPTWPSPSSQGPFLIPDTESLIDAVMCRLLASPYDKLDARFNGILLQIFESYRNVSDEKHQLQAHVEKEVDRRTTVEVAMHRSALQWSREKRQYQDEVKRLELLLAQGNRGLAEVTTARQHSLLRNRKRGHGDMMPDESLETILEFLEKTKRYEDKQWSSQRATMRKKATSPSADMRRLSRTLMAKSSTTDIHDSFPFGTPPADMSTLARASILEQVDAPTGTSNPKTSFSDDASLSTFSCPGDLLPDETTGADVDLIEAAGTDNDFVAIKRIAQVLAKRRQVDPDAVMPKLLQLFAAQTFERGQNSSLPNALDLQVPRSKSVVAGRALSVAPLRKNHTLMTKASGLFQKLKHQNSIDAQSSNSRRFSFEPGDDAHEPFHGPVADTLPAAVRSRLVRKSVSMSSLPEVALWKAALQEAKLSPVEQSPTNSGPTSESKGVSKIPTPVYTSGMARPRREREDSASSLMTAIKHSDNLSRRSDSISSSPYSSPSTSRIDLTLGMKVSELACAQRVASSNRLLEHTNSLRGNAFATIAAAKAANVTTTGVDQWDSALHDKHPCVQNSNNSRPSMQSRTESDMSGLRKENVRPMRRADLLDDHECLDATL